MSGGGIPIADLMGDGGLLDGPMGNTTWHGFTRSNSRGGEESRQHGARTPETPRMGGGALWSRYVRLIALWTVGEMPQRCVGAIVLDR